jgi:uncharacterized DUF497 family protein
MFDWDLRKARSNRRKHGVSLDEAATAIFMVNSIDKASADCSKSSEARRAKS